jgi:hypothetical protein
LRDNGSVGIGGERFYPEPFPQETVAIGVQEVLEEEDEEAGNEENGADEVGHFFGRSFSHKIQDKDEDHLEDGEEELGQDEDMQAAVWAKHGGNLRKKNIPEIPGRGVGSSG